MGPYVTLGVIILAGFAALNPASMSWVYIGAFVAIELWLVRRMAAVAAHPVPVDTPPYNFTDEEAGLVRRYRFYFSYPGIAQQASSVLAALGLTALVLAPWLTFKQGLLQAVLIGLNLFAVARLTKRLSPLMALRIAASRGDRNALRALELHDPLWDKIKLANRGATTPPPAP